MPIFKDSAAVSDAILYMHNYFCTVQLSIADSLPKQRYYLKYACSLLNIFLENAKQKIRVCMLTHSVNVLVQLSES